MLSERFTFCFKITLKWNLTKSHATRLKSAKYKTHDKRTTLKWMDFEIDKLKSILYKNNYPQDLIDKCIKQFLDKILAPKPVVSTLPKKENWKFSV